MCKLHVMYEHTYAEMSSLKENEELGRGRREVASTTSYETYLSSQSSE